MTRLESRLKRIESSVRDQEEQGASRQRAAVQDWLKGLSSLTLHVLLTGSGRDSSSTQPPTEWVSPGGNFQFDGYTELESRRIREFLARPLATGAPDSALPGRIAALQDKALNGQISEKSLVLGVIDLVTGGQR